MPEPRGGLQHADEQPSGTEDLPGEGDPAHETGECQRQGRELLFLLYEEFAGPYQFCEVLRNQLPRAAILRRPRMDSLGRK